MLLSRALVVAGAVGGAVAAVTGQARCNQIMCITATREDGIDTFTYRPVKDIPADEFGWAAIGFGNQMIVIMWPNEDGSFTVSQRQAVGHHMPPVVPEPPRVASIDTSNTYSNSTRTELSFSMPSSGDNQISVLWAMSRANPRNPSPDATLLQHAWRGLEFMNMDEEFDGSVVTEASPFPVHGKTYKDNGRPSFVLIAHIVCGVFATMLALPGGVVVPRLTRGLTTSRWWFPFHAINQGVTALALVCAAFGVALGFGGEFDTNHRKMGVVLFALIIVQTILGLFSHFCKPGPRLRPYTFETKRGRGPTNFMHVALGIVCVGVGWSLSWTGFTNEWPSRGHGNTGKGWRYGWGIVVMLWLIAYILGIIFMLPRQLRIESRQREYDKHEENYNVYRESAVALANEFYLEERKERTLSMSDGETSINASGDTSTHSTDASPWAQWGGVYYTHGPDSGKSALSAISGLSALSAPSQYEGETVAPAVPVPVQPSTSDMPSGATLSPPTQAATLHSPNPGLMYGGSSTTFASETARSPTLNDGSSPSTKFTPTFSVEPPLPSPREQEDLGGQVVGSSPPRVNLNLDVGWRLSVQPPKRTPSPRLPWAGQVKKQEFV